MKTSKNYTANSAFEEIRSCNIDLSMMQELKKEHMHSLLIHAKQNTKYYSEVNGDNLCDFPIVNKQLIIENYQDFLVEPSKIPYQSGELHIQSTSGSTGIPFRIPQDTRCRSRLVGGLRYGNYLAGHNYLEPMVVLRALSHHHNDNITFSKLDKESNILYINNTNLNNKENIEKIIKLINEHKAKLVRIYATVLDVVTKYAVDNNLKFFSNPVFLVMGERLQMSVRDRIVNALHCNLISQYSTEELGAIGTTKLNPAESDFEYHLSFCNSIVEILKFDRDEPVDDGELGRIVITDMFNYALPLIRYDIGDAGFIANKKDGEILSIKNLQGKSSDLIFDTSGNIVDMLTSIPSIVYNNSDIQQWQFIQNSEFEYTLNLSVKTEFGEDFLNEVYKSFKELLGVSAELTVNFTDELPVLASGKRKVIVSYYKKY